jgi:hypothetical protein
MMPTDGGYLMQRQNPLKARGGNPHDFKLRFDDWEAAVFDHAAYFTAIAMHPRRRFEFSTFAEAVAFARSLPLERFCLYAITESGRSMIPEQVSWDDWVERERQKKVEGQPKAGPCSC